MATLSLGAVAGGYTEPDYPWTQLTNTGWFSPAGDSVRVMGTKELNGNVCVYTTLPNSIYVTSDPKSMTSWTKYSFTPSGILYTMGAIAGRYIVGKDDGGISGAWYSTNLTSWSASDLRGQVHEMINAGSFLYAVGHNTNNQVTIWRTSDGISWTTLWIGGSGRMYTMDKQLISGTWYLWLGGASGVCYRFNTSNNTIDKSLQLTDGGTNQTQPVDEIKYVPAWDYLVAYCGGIMWATPSIDTWGWQGQLGPGISSGDSMGYQAGEIWNSAHSVRNCMTIDEAGELVVVGRNGAGTSTFPLFRYPTKPVQAGTFYGVAYGGNANGAMVTNKPTRSWFTQGASTSNFVNLHYLPEKKLFLATPGGSTGSNDMRGFAFTTRTTATAMV